MRLLILSALFTALGAPTNAHAQSDPADLLDRILADSVRNERVDYSLIKSKYAADLKAFLDEAAKLDPAQLSAQQRLAHYINLYNATMIQAVIDRYREGYSPAEKEYAIFKEPLVRLKGKTISLNELENGIIRPEFKDPRVHAALVCAARSCPPLLPRAYRAEDLDKVLDANMRRFVSDPARNPIDLPKKQLKLSQIFDWYAEDFGGKGSIAAYVSKYLGRDVSGFEVSFVDYSWELNDAR